MTRSGIKKQTDYLTVFSILFYGKLFVKKTRKELVNLTIYWLLVDSSADIWNELREAAKPYSVKDLDWFKEGIEKAQKINSSLLWK